MVEQRDELAVLADRTGAIACGGQQLDEPALSEFVEWVELHPPPRRLDRAAGIASGEAGGREPFKEIADGPLHAHGAARLPIVEGRTVAEREAGQERTPRQRGRGFEVSGPGRCRHALELRQIDGGGGRIERDLSAPDGDPCVTDGGPER